MTAPSPQAARRWILTIGVAVITVSGAYLGANLKADQDLRRERKVAIETNTDQQLKILENQMSKMVAIRDDLKKKLAEIEERQRQGRNNGGKGS